MQLFGSLYDLNQMICNTMGTDVRNNKLIINTFLYSKFFGIKIFRYFFRYGKISCVWDVNNLIGRYIFVIYVLRYVRRFGLKYLVLEETRKSLMKILTREVETCEAQIETLTRRNTTMHSRYDQALAGFISRKIEAENALLDLEESEPIDL